MRWSSHPDLVLHHRALRVIKDSFPASSNVRFFRNVINIFCTSPIRFNDSPASSNPGWSVIYNGWCWYIGHVRVTWQPDAHMHNVTQFENQHPTSRQTVYCCRVKSNIWPDGFCLWVHHSLASRPVGQTEAYLKPRHVAQRVRLRQRPVSFQALGWRDVHLWPACGNGTHSWG